MADDQLRGLTLDNVFIDGTSSMVPIPQEWRTDWENIDAPREFISVDYSNLEARWVLPEVPQSVLTIEMLRQARGLLENRRTPNRQWGIPPININAGHVNHITATEVRERQESRRAMINNMFATYGKIFPTPEKEKKQIKRGNPWVQ